MSDSNCNCCCAYLTPPWWVTMGYAPPAGGRTGVVYPSAGAAPGVVVAPPAATHPATTVPAPTTPTKGGGLLGGVVGVGKDVGNSGSDILHGNLTDVPGDIANGLSDILHLF